MKQKESILGMAFFGPALVLLTLFLFLPMVLTLVFSFTDYFALNPDMTHFVGLENYINIFKDELFVKSFFNTVKFVLIIVPCQCIGALVLALAINKVTHCKKYFKVAFFIPVVMSLDVYKRQQQQRCLQNNPVCKKTFINMISGQFLRELLFFLDF